MVSNYINRKVYGYTDTDTDKIVKQPKKTPYSKTEQYEDWLKKAYGVSNDPLNSDYFGKLYQNAYGNTMTAAQGNLDRNMQQIYGENVNTAKLQQDAAMKAYGQGYQNQAIQANTQLQQMQAVYGANQSRLAELGLTGSGYNAALMQKAYGGYQDTLANAYNVAEQGKMTAAQVYGANEREAKSQYGKGALTAEQIYGDTQFTAQQARDKALADKEAEYRKAYGSCGLKRV